MTLSGAVASGRPSGGDTKAANRKIKSDVLEMTFSNNGKSPLEELKNTIDELRTRGHCVDDDILRHHEPVFRDVVEQGEKFQAEVRFENMMGSHEERRRHLLGTHRSHATVRNLCQVLLRRDGRGLEDLTYTGQEIGADGSVAYAVREEMVLRVRVKPWRGRLHDIKFLLSPVRANGGVQMVLFRNQQ